MSNDLKALLEYLDNYVNCEGTREEAAKYKRLADVLRADSSIEIKYRPTSFTRIKGTFDIEIDHEDGSFALVAENGQTYIFNSEEYVPGNYTIDQTGKLLRSDSNA